MAFRGCAKRSLATILYGRAFSSYCGTSSSTKISSWASKRASLDHQSTETQIAIFANRPCGSAIFLRRFNVEASSSSGDQMSLIRQLRERTSAPIKDVKAALVNCNWDIGLNSETPLP